MVLEGMGKEGWRDALVETNHEGLSGKDLAEKNGCFEVLDFEVTGSR
jgi:hypothetical protein